MLQNMLWVYIISFIIFQSDSNIKISSGHTPVLDATLGTIPPDGHGDIYDPKNFFIRVFNVLEALGEYFVLYIYSKFLLFVKFENHENFQSH